MRRIHGRRDIAHHHPRVTKNRSGWTWSCGCGATCSLITRVHLSWHQAMVEALGHSTEIAA
jgi:hypothetical protein